MEYHSDEGILEFQFNNYPTITAYITSLLIIVTKQIVSPDEYVTLEVMRNRRFTFVTTSDVNVVNTFNPSALVEKYYLVGSGVTSSLRRVITHVNGTLPSIVDNYILFNGDVSMNFNGLIMSMEGPTNDLGAYYDISWMDFFRTPWERTHLVVSNTRSPTQHDIALVSCSGMEETGLREGSFIADPYLKNTSEWLFNFVLTADCFLPYLQYKIEEETEFLNSLFERCLAFLSMLPQSDYFHTGEIVNELSGPIAVDFLSIENTVNGIYFALHGSISYLDDWSSSPFHVIFENAIWKTSDNSYQECHHLITKIENYQQVFEYTFQLASSRFTTLETITLFFENVGMWAIGLGFTIVFSLASLIASAVSLFLQTRKKSRATSDSKKTKMTNQVKIINQNELI